MHAQYVKFFNTSVLLNFKSLIYIIHEWLFSKPIFRRDSTTFSVACCFFTVSVLKDSLTDGCFHLFIDNDIYIFEKNMIDTVFEHWNTNSSTHFNTSIYRQQIIIQTSFIETLMRLDIYNLEILFSKAENYSYYGTILFIASKFRFSS